MGSGLCFSYSFQFSSWVACFAGPLLSPWQPADCCNAIPCAWCHYMGLLFPENNLGNAFPYSRKERLISVPLHGCTACHAWTAASCQEVLHTQRLHEGFMPWSLCPVPSRHCSSEMCWRATASALENLYHDRARWDQRSTSLVWHLPVAKTECPEKQSI